MSVDPGSDASARRPEERFETTRWSMVLRAGKDSSPGHEHALAALCERYWYPLYVYIRRYGYSANDAKDVTQAFFAHLLEKESLKAADPERGRFRSFLLTAFKNFVANQREKRRAQKRGGDVQLMSIDFEDGESRYQFEPADNWTPEKIYERRWVMTLLESVLVQLRGEYHNSGRGELFDRCKGHLTGVGAPYQEIAANLQMSVGAVRTSVHRLRARYRSILEREVAATLDDEQTVETELEYLMGVIRGD